VTVTFTDDPEPYNSHETVARVTKAINAAASFDAHIVDRSWQIERSKEFVQKVRCSFSFASLLFPSAAMADWEETCS
jgi:hypothetical protein